MIYNERTPFILKNMGDPTLIENELFIDPNDGLIYIYKESGSHIAISYARIYDAISNALSKRLGKLSPIQVNELVKKSNELYKFMEDNKNDNINTPESNILNIFKVFNGFDSNNNLKILIDNMVDKQEGKTLVSNSFELDHILKLNSITKDANFYAHPETIQCNLGEKVESVTINGDTRTGNVVITKDDIGYGGVESGANNYEHPRKQQCAAGVVSVNGKKGYVDLEKRDFKIYNLPNVAPATYDDYDNNSDETLFLSNTAIEHLDNKLANIINRNTNKIEPEYIVEFTVSDKDQIRSVDIGGVGNTEFNDDNKMIFRLYHSNAIISIVNRKRENVVIENLPNLMKNTPLKVHYTSGGTIELL